MAALDPEALNQFVNETIEAFHDARLARLGNIKLSVVLRRKNPYLFRAKNLLTAGDFIQSLMDAYLSSSEEELFGRVFLEELAIYVSSEIANGRKSSAEGIDLEFEKDTTHYLVSIKSGPNWGNSSQKRRLEDNFKSAVRIQQQGQRLKHVQPVLGICYGRARPSNNGVYIKYEGQIFWHFVSDDPSLYTNIVEPIGYRAKEHNEAFMDQRAALVNQFTAQFISEFCYPDGRIDWQRLVAFNSGNLPEES